MLVRGARGARSQQAAGAEPVEVVPVRSGADRREFLRLPWLTQRDDPAWIPPLLAERAAFVDRRHPFLRHGQAALLLARQRGAPAGRLLVSADDRYDAAHGERAAFFGMFESLPDPRVAHALLDAAAAWARARGRDRLVGPIDYAIHYQSGLLVDGFEHPPRLMMNHNPRWYPALLESWGLAGRLDLHAWRLPVEDPPPVLARWRAVAARAAARSGVTVRPARLADYDAELARLRTVYNEAWRGTWGFVAMSDEEFGHLARDLRPLLVPELLLLAEARGEPVGFALTLPDLNEALRPLDGRLTTLGLPIGLVRLLWRLRRVRTARLLTLGVRPAWRRRGVAEALVLRSWEAGRAHGLREAELGWTAADNPLIENPIRALGAEPYKTYRIYARDLPPAVPP
jgi:ribosomal protein S18 acetylase RimI-like enzyme